MDVWIAGAIFLVAYGLIATERFDRTLIALLGGLLVVVLGIIDQHQAIEAIDFNVIFLLAGMMIIANGLAKTGFFEYVAGRVIQLSRGEPFRLLILLSVLTAVLAGLGRASAEVGAVMIVGDNIDGVTRVMTTTIALETSKGDLPLALGLGIVLIAIVLALNAAAFLVKEAAQRRYG